jgi:hypothetical protein
LPPGTGAIADPSVAVEPELTGSGRAMLVHFQSAGQSVSTSQVVAFGWQDPGNEVVVVQVGGVPASTAGFGALPPASGKSAGPELLELVDPPPELTVPPPPSALPAEQPIATLGWQVNPSPQSAAALHGSCHLNAHCLVIVVVQAGSVLVGVPASHAVFGAQITWATPPEQLPETWSWQTIPAPQSASTEHVFGSQIRIVPVEAPASTASLAQSAFGGQAGAGSAMTPSDTQA